MTKFSIPVDSDMADFNIDGHKNKPQSSQNSPDSSQNTGEHQEPQCSTAVLDPKDGYPYGACCQDLMEPIDSSNNPKNGTPRSKFEEQKSASYDELNRQPLQPSKQNADMKPGHQTNRMPMTYHKENPALTNRYAQPPIQIGSQQREKNKNYTYNPRINKSPKKKNVREYYEALSSKHPSTRSGKQPSNYGLTTSMEKGTSCSSGMSCPESRSGSSDHSSYHKRQHLAVSSHNISSVSEGPVCRICHEGDLTEVLVTPCNCAGSLGLLHVSCLQTWLGSSNKTSCEICNFQFTLKRRPMSLKQFWHDPGTSRDKRHMVCDLTSFMFITPLTLATAWMCLQGAVKYYSKGGWELGGLITLSVTLLSLYTVWLIVIARHNWRLWRDWQMFHQEVTLLGVHPPVKQEKNQSHRKSEASGSHGSRSTVGSVQLQSIKISMQGPMVHYKGKKDLSPKQDLMTYAPVAQSGMKASKDVLYEKERQQVRDSNLSPCLTRELDSAKECEKRVVEHSKVPYASVLGKFQSPRQTACIEQSLKSKDCYISTGIEDDICNDNKTCQSSQYNDSYVKRQQNNYPLMHERAFQKSDVLARSETVGPNRQTPRSDPLKKASAAVFSRGNSPVEDDTRVNQDYTKEWVEQRAGLVEGGGANRMVSSSSGETNH